MANLWSKLIATSNQKKLVNQAIADGDLHAAAEHLCKHRYHETRTGQKTAQRLALDLIKSAANNRSLDNLPEAWLDLDYADNVAPSHLQDQISRDKSNTLELTIENADALLLQGKIAHAIQLVEEIRKRKIRDWRSDRIDAAARCIRDADEAAAHGRWPQAIEELRSAKTLRPDLGFLDSKLSTFEFQRKQFNEMKKQLESALLDCHWARVGAICQKLLTISPKYGFAIDAQRQWSQRKQKKTAIGIIETRHSKPRTEAPTQVDERLLNPPLNSYPVGVHSSTYELNPESGTEPANPTTNEQQESRFMIWVDGVGGYLVCPSTCNTVGQAANYPNVQIPMQGDLQQRHVRFETVEGSHLLQPLAGVTVDERETAEATQLKNGQIIGLDSSVRIKYVQQHPLSKTARLEFASRHRTKPWSDGVLLATHPIILGPSKKNHIVCSKWAKDVVIFRQGDTWKAKTDGKFLVDSVPQEGMAEIKLDSRIEGDDFSFSLEPL